MARQMKTMDGNQAAAHVSYAFTDDIFVNNLLYVEIAFEIEVGSSAESAFVRVAVRSADADTVNIVDLVFLHHVFDEVGDVFQININVEIFVCWNVTTCNDLTVFTN